MSEQGGAGQSQPHCASCGAEPRPGDRFCASCGTPLAAGNADSGLRRVKPLPRTDRRGTGTDGQEHPTPRTDTGTIPPSKPSPKRFLMVVLASLGVYLVLYALNPTLLLVVILVGCLVVLIVRLAKVERGSSNRRGWDNWSPGDRALFLASWYMMNEQNERRRERQREWRESSQRRRPR
jgi:hypothetical protein